MTLAAAQARGMQLARDEATAQELKDWRTSDPHRCAPSAPDPYRTTS